MKRPLLMPKLGLTMTEGALVEWTVRPGQAFAAEATLFVVETEKTATEVPAEGAGVLVDIVVGPGATVPVGTLLGHWDDGVAENTHAAAAARADAADTLPVAGSSAVGRAGAICGEVTGAIPGDVAGTTSGDAAGADACGAQASASTPSRILATPLARRLAASHGVALATIAGSGPRGRVRARDVEAAIAAPGAATYGAITPTPATSPADAMPAVAGAPASVVAAAPVAPVPSVTPAPSVTRPPSSTESTIARRLGAAKRDIPHFYLAVEAEVSRLLALREELKAAQPARRHTLNHFVLAAVARALAALPSANVVWAEAGIVQFGTVDVGMAVATPRGLVAPVLRDLGGASLAQIAQRSAAAIERAQAGRLTAAEQEGGAITVSNAGMHDVTYMTSIINPGQSLILGVGSVRELFRPDAQGHPALRREMGLVLSADHRVHDAVSALALLKRIVTHLEQPLGLVL